MQPDAVKAFIHERINLLEDPADLNELLEIVTAFVNAHTTPTPEGKQGFPIKVAGSSSPYLCGSLKLQNHDAYHLPR